LQIQFIVGEIELQPHTDNLTESIPGKIFTSAILDSGTNVETRVHDPSDLVYQIGLWISGLESFLVNYPRLFAGRNSAGSGTHWERPFGLTMSALKICAKANFRLRNTLTRYEDGTSDFPDFGGAAGIDLRLTGDDVLEISTLLRSVLSYNQALMRAKPLDLIEWNIWREFVLRVFTRNDPVRKFKQAAVQIALDRLPDLLRQVVDGPTNFSAEYVDLRSVLQRSACILRALEQIDEMLKNDRPLKPALLIFSYIYEQTSELVNYINNRLARYPDEETELFNSLDAASYAASLELKKVFHQELNGIIGIRPANSNYSRLETAFALLTDRFQHIVTGFARLIEPDIEMSSIYPGIREKFVNSVELRRDLWIALKQVQAAEADPEEQVVEATKAILSGFMDQSFNYLFHKDKETVERFSEEIFAALDKKDLVPILHRFRAFLETLFGQVSNRAVLVGHPFEHSER
jgi:hypothetical protein